MRRSRKRRSRRKKKTSCNPQEPESASIYFDHDEGQVIVSFPERSKNENMTVGEIQRLEKPSFVIIEIYLLRIFEERLSSLPLLSVTT